jgi:hypothetical protein
MSMSKKAKAKANVIDLATFRETRTAPSLQSTTSQEAPQETPRWTHVDGALWCLTQSDDLPEVADLLNDWEMNFLEDIAQQERPATPRQVRCINRIILMINGMLAEMRRKQADAPNPAA